MDHPAQATYARGGCHRLVESAVDARNAERQVPYTLLMPTRVPTSITI